MLTIKHKLVDISAVALTFDIWSARKCSRGFGAITAHFIDDSVRFKSVVLQFEYLPYPHDADTLKRFLSATIEEYNLDSKLVAITTDNARNNIVAIEALDAELELNIKSEIGFLHFRCLAHVINLCVRDALKVFKPLVSNIKSFVVILRGSTKRSERFSALEQSMIDSGEVKPLEKLLNLKEDVETRWNSTYLMLERALQLEQVVTRALERKSLFPELEKVEPIKWAQLRIVVDFLKPFLELTEMLSGEKYSTMSLVTSALPVIKAHLCQNFEDEVIVEAAFALKDKLEEYEPYNCDHLVLVATILDSK